MNIDYIYTLLGLDFWTPQQFYFVLCTISYIELVIMLIVMWKKKYFIEKIDIVYLIVAIQFIAYALYKVEHVTFLFSLLYINFFLLLIYVICSQYKKGW
jgi:hypothetical protein